jgi:uncharacterized protein with ParB-like and HNH nuclease domain
MDISSGPKNLGELFTGNVLVSVPSFQRNFVWKADQLKQFLDDLFYSAENDDSHFFGPIVIYDATKNSNGPKNLELVDGQQRITTSVMVISILRDLLHDRRYVQDSTYGDINLEDPLKNLLFGGQYANKPKFEAGYLIRSFFKDAVILAPNDKLRQVTPRGTGLAATEIAATKDLRKAYLFILKNVRSRFDSLSEDDIKSLYHKLIKSLTSNFQIYSLVVADEMDAYQLFESINYLGFRLEPGDLLKSITLRKIQFHDKNSLDQALKDWDDLVKNLNGFSISKFLRHYLVSEKKTAVQSSKIFKYFKEEIERNELSAKATLAKLLKASKYYAFALNGKGLESDEVTDEMRKIARRLDLISETHRVLLLSIFRSSFLSSPKLREQAFRAVEYFSFRAICAKQNAQDVENIYQDFGHKLSSVDSQKSLNDWCKDLMAEAISDQDLASIQVNNSPYAGIQFDPREDLGRYAILCLEDDIGGGWTAMPTLEHLAPQNPPNGSPWFAKVGNAKIDYDTYVHWWGNFTWLEKPLNSSIKNSEWPRKITGDPAKNLDGLSASGFFLTRKLLKLPDWTGDLIKDRGDWIFSTLMEIRSSKWVLTGEHLGRKNSLWPPNGN